MLGGARLQTYLKAAGGDIDRATDLYLWVNELAGALHSQLSFVELAVRNAVDPRLRVWNAEQGYSADWALPGQAAEPVYRILRTPLADAQERAEKESRRRDASHPRHRAAVNQDDVIAQLMFGAWAAIVHPISPGSASRQQQLWREVTAEAFPYSASGDIGRHRLGRQLDTLRKLRDRVAHHDNLLGVNVVSRLNGMLSVLGQIDPELATLASAKNGLRRLAKEDPRKGW